MLTDSLPIEVSRSNVEATKEVDEPIHGMLGSKGRSVWFEWEAASDGLVTVGSCGSDFTTVLAVYTGTTVNGLTNVTGDPPTTDGPGCSTGNGVQVTFEAHTDTSYKIAIDGDPFYFPPQPPPVGEGSFNLQIGATPVPVNDDFAAATPLVGSTTEEPGEDPFYFASAFGFNWGATKESGEPDHDGDPGGASVWYSWTAPESGVARIGACCALGQLFGVYTGSSVDALTQHDPTLDPPLGYSFSVSAGTTYRIAVDGEFNAGAAVAEMGSFTASVSMRLRPRPKAAAATPSSNSAGSVPPPGDTEPPETFIHRKVLKSKPPTIVIHFGSSEPGSTFRCRHNKGAFIPCRAPITNRRRRAGRHSFEIAAVDAAGNVDPSPAVTRFYVPQPNRRPKKSS